MRLEGNWEGQEGRETREQQTAGYFKTTQAMHIGRFSLLACTHLAASEYASDLFRLDGKNRKGGKRGETQDRFKQAAEYIFLDKPCTQECNTSFTL